MGTTREDTTSGTSECERVVRALWEYLDGRLAPLEVAEIERHLEACAGCRSHAEHEAALLAALGRLRGSDDDAERLRTRVLTALREARASASSEDRGAS